ncbi:hypothetical protein [Aeromonas sobria]|uniref:hypothetical protein n=1 Tax=Aeromonas sobria TaxID=646 RepID=UPI0026E9E8F4|nr:hypothetical protein [Aeromonas sobria]
MTGKFELIVDSRLTPTMDRIRNGSVMMFREPNPQDRSFISEANAGVILKHPTNKAMYADLVDGQWVWRNGCRKCDPSQSPYIVCDEHDKCDSCGISRKDLKEAPWGLGDGGWRCKDCQAVLDEREKQAALSRVAKKVQQAGGYDEWEFSGQDKVKCPHCATEWSPDEDVNSAENYECGVCGGLYTIEPCYEVTYTTRVVGERLLPSSNDSTDC